MRKRAWFRVVMAVWGLWFTAALSEAAGLHTCAMHGQHSGAAHAAGDVHGSAAQSGHHAPVHTPGTACTCFGLCCGASIMAAEVTIQRARESVQCAVVVTPNVATQRLIRAHALPFANGPPQAA